MTKEAELLAALAAQIDVLNVKGLAFDRIAAQLGSSAEWNSPADYLQDFAELINAACKKLELPRVSDQDSEGLLYWRKIADSMGIDHDEDDSSGGRGWVT